ncbi:methylated-DNA-[protein]-cysteine S-methyltransferase [Saccharothrix australiensis]|uniref:Methylated-DNA--protein-cysteine methyltransferase n=1 Tax=Saccharothrix australiensis TaxID=2072 RepID=A0A495VUM0_9PSEU|nr:methylated-DNA-[protein]-cysteine S-methyltransferase [Saccharothrix australiensis]
MAHTTVDSPVGPLTLVAAAGALSGLYMTDQRYRPAQESFGPEDASLFGDVIAQLEEYFAGRLTEFDVPLDLRGTPFQRTVWAALLSVPYGQTVSYGELAAALGRPTAARAVGMANGRNPISIIVPCHRVVGSTGDLTGYGGGLARKRQLLEFEAQTPTPGRSAGRSSGRPEGLFEAEGLFEVGGLFEGRSADPRAGLPG